MADADVLTEPQAAAALRVSAKTLARWRQAGRVSYDCTPGGRIRYSWDDIVALRRSMRVSANVPVCANTSGEDDAAPA
jgi:predicted site-specific integrase-resolvase